MIKSLIFVVFLSAVAAQECRECEKTAFFCRLGNYTLIEGCGEGDGCACACSCFCNDDSNCIDGKVCKIPKSPVTGVYAKTGACVDEEFPGVGYDEEVPKASSSMVWLPIVIVVVVIILLIVAYMVWSKKNKEETAEDEGNDAKEMEPLSTEAV